MHIYIKGVRQTQPDKEKDEAELLKPLPPAADCTQAAAEAGDKGTQKLRQTKFSASPIAQLVRAPH